jgi:hypothetical protein
MRGVPYTLALGTSTAGGRTGWSGDGSPGTLRAFATGAVTQHFPKTLNRVPGAVAKLEDALAFYTTDTFNNSIAGDGRAFVLTKDEINAIGAFLRALNAVENIRSSNAYAQRSIDPDELQPAEELVDLAIAETTDVIEVLTKGPIKLYPTAVAALKDARAALKRNDIHEAIALQEGARADIVVAGP